VFAALGHNERVSFYPQANDAQAPRKQTLHVVADSSDPAGSAEAIAEAAAILRSGGTVAFVTETVYGLGANALDPHAVEKIFIAKQRPAWDPLIVHVADALAVSQITTGIPEPARLWMEQFCPGPLTLLLPRAASIPDAVTAGRPRVGIRIPAHPVAQALLRAAGLPIAAPSANLFGHVSPTTAAHVLADLDGRIDAVLDGGPTRHGLESSVVDCCEDPCLIYRPGAITLEQLQSIWPRVIAYSQASGPNTPSPGTEIEDTVPQSLPSPGLGMRHYAPRAQLVLIEQGSGQAEALLSALRHAPGAGVMLPAGLLSSQDRAAIPAATDIFEWGAVDELEAQASQLFAGLRTLDTVQCRQIICPLPAAAGIGVALCDRLRKAARPK
jgi:L-threonylcarbamoyladenylate synthase